jgi:hypothetical protein
MAANKVSISAVVLTGDDSGRHDLWGSSIRQLGCLHGGHVISLPSKVAVDDFDSRLLPLFENLPNRIATETDNRLHRRRQYRGRRRGDPAASGTVHWTLPYVSPVNGQPVITASLSVYSNLTDR